MSERILGRLRVTSPRPSSSMGDALVLVLVLVLASTVVEASRAHAQSHAGVVMDGATAAPLPGARVVVNASVRGVSDAMGRFSLDAPAGVASEVVLATHPGRLSDYLVLPSGSTTLDLVLTVAPYPIDTDGFEPESPYVCTECHAGHGTGWSARGGYDDSAHSRSALNPRVLDIWRGTASGRSDATLCAEVGGELVSVTDASGTSTLRCYVGAGLLPDLNPQCGHAGQPRCDDHAALAASRPTEWSDCAGCHTPGTAIRVPSALDLDVAEADWIPGSVTCAGCHRIADVGDPNDAGVLVGATTVRGDLASGLPLGLGPLDDAGAARMVTGHAPIFGESRLCAPCHQDTYTAAGMSPRWAAVGGVPSEQTYAEWLESPYASGARERTCQGCHMPSLESLGITPEPSLIGSGGPMRTTDVMHAHDFSALTSAAALEAALDLSVAARREAGAVVVDASITNVAVGHGFPSGVTSRNALVVVTAELPSGRLVEIGGDVLPLYAGSYDRGVVASAAGATITLDHAVDASAVGRELRLWTDTTVRHEHESFGLLRSLPATERALTLRAALGRYRITAVRGAEVDVDATAAALGDLDGARFAIGDDERLAGVAGLGLSKVNVAADGTQNMPFWRAVDVLWDNRLAPDETQRTEHRFALPDDAAGTITIRARVLYRRAFADLAAQRGWDGNELVALEAVTTLVVDAPDAGGAPDAAVAGDGGPTTVPSGCGCAVRTATPSGACVLVVGLVCLVLRRRRA